MISDASLIIANTSLDSMKPRENPDPNYRTLKTYEQRCHDFKMDKKRKISNQTHVSNSDPDATLVSRKTNYNKLCYKVHSTIDQKYRIIVDFYVTTGAFHECKIFTGRVNYLLNKFKYNISEWIADIA